MEHCNEIWTTLYHRTHWSSNYIANLSKVDKELEDAKIVSASDHVSRSTKVTWINDKNTLSTFLTYQAANKNAGWDFHIDRIEPLQYAEYSVGDEFGWHVDQHNKPYDDGRVRKISFSIFLNSDFKGGEFDIELGIQNRKRDTLQLISNQTLHYFFNQIIGTE